MKFSHLMFFSLLLSSSIGFGQNNIPEILSSKKIQTKNYLPDFSYAGYWNGEKQIETKTGKIFKATDFGVVANDELDDSKALIAAIEAMKKIPGNVVLELPAGRIILSEVLYIERSNFLLRGAGSDENGTEIYCPRPMMYFKDPEILQELREYLVELDKRQIEKENNIDLPFSQYAWSGGIIWTNYPGERIKSYLPKYERPARILARVTSGNRGENTFIVEDASQLKTGDVMQLELFNKEGKEGKIIQEMYQHADIKIGSHHYNYPNMALVRQQVEIIGIEKNKVTIKTPLTLAIVPEYKAQLVEWKHLKEVGIENFKITFPVSPRIAHHVEQGYNGIFLTRVYNGWVRNIAIHNADSGILTEEIANVTIDDITSTGENLAHYTVAMAGVHNVLAKNLTIYQEAVHPLSFNTFSTKNVYQSCEVFTKPILDQHSGANLQNLFDNIKVHIEIDDTGTYPLFEGGGAGYWKPSHGAFSTFWNIEVLLKNEGINHETIVLNGMKDGPFARIIGIYGNKPYLVQYEPEAYIKFVNQSLSIPSLYNYQLNQRLKN
ncbi:hypothetical protein [Namhaeicola litoreus]|uniref:DUF4955 domain-containing protein n=1 Tax=Namhaeicola litoreus TaxID=1052145 RepID=A0ABW3Y2C9_9FLAO